MTKIKLVLILVVLFFVLVFRFHSLNQTTSNYTNGQNIVIESFLSQEPKISGKYQKFYIEDGFGERILVIAEHYPQFNYGDFVRISGKLAIIEREGVSNRKIELLTNEKVAKTIFLPKIEAVKNSDKLQKNQLKNALAVVSSIRQNIVFQFEKVLPPISSSLLLGIVFGIKEGMPEEFQENLKTAGVMHVIAASGMNVTMVGGFLSSIFLIFFKRQIALIFSIFGIIFYATLSGLEPSIVRASIMGVLAFFAQILGRQTLSAYLLFLAGYLMLLVSPDLIFDIGFQLSFLSTLGIMYIKPIFEKSKKFERFFKSMIGESVTTTFSAQIATFPVLLVNFGTYSIWSIVVNGLILWMIPILMVLGGLGVLFGALLEFFGRLFLYLSLPLLLYFETIVNYFSKLGGIINFELVPWQFALAYYFILTAIVSVLSHKSELKPARVHP